MIIFEFIITSDFLSFSLPKINLLTVVLRPTNPIVVMNEDRELNNARVPYSFRPKERVIKGKEIKPNKDVKIFTIIM